MDAALVDQHHVRWMRPDTGLLFQARKRRTGIKLYKGRLHQGKGIVGQIKVALDRGRYAAAAPVAAPIMTAKIPMPQLLSGVCCRVS